MNRRTAMIAASAVFVLAGGTGTAVALAGGSEGGQPAEVEHPTTDDASHATGDTASTASGTIRGLTAAPGLTTESPETEAEPVESPEATGPETEPKRSTEVDDNDSTEHESDAEETKSPEPTAPASGHSSSHESEHGHTGSHD